MNTATVIVGLIGVFLGWALKSWSDSRSWHRQHLLDADSEVLKHADETHHTARKLWSMHRTRRVPASTVSQVAEDLREAIAGLDRASGRLRILASVDGELAAAALFVACRQLVEMSAALPAR